MHSRSIKYKLVCAAALPRVGNLMQFMTKSTIKSKRMNSAKDLCGW